MNVIKAYIFARVVTMSQVQDQAEAKCRKAQTALVGFRPQTPGLRRVC